MYTLRNCRIHDHIIAQSPDLTVLVAIKLWNQVHYQVETAIYDDLGDLVTRRKLNSHLYQVELSVRP